MKTKDNYIRASIHHVRSVQYEQMGNYELALAYYQKFTLLADSLSVLRNTQSIAEVQAQYDVESVYRKYSNICLVLAVIILLLLLSLCFYQRRKWINERFFNQQLAQSEVRTHELKTEFLLAQRNRAVFEQEAERLGKLVLEQIDFISKLEHRSKQKSEVLVKSQSALTGMQFYILSLQGGDMSQLNVKELRCLIDCYKQLDPTFFYWVEQEGVDLSPRETVQCILFRIGKNKKEIMDMLRCSDGSYRTLKNRIKKGLQIDVACNDVEGFVLRMS